MIDYKEEQKMIYIGIYKDNVKVGQVWVDMLNKNISEFEIFVPYQNKGYGQEALKYFINNYGIKYLEVKADNEKAKHIYEKLGFKYINPKYYQMELQKEVLEENKIELLKALDEIKESYDAFYFENKSDDLTHCTHKEQFEKLSQVKGLSVRNGALSWVRYTYDCHYKYEFEDEKGTAFEYIRNLINKEGVEDE